MPEELRAAITLREVEGLSYEEIAQKMDCPIGTVRSRIFRAREAIDAELRPCWTPNAAAPRAMTPITINDDRQTQDRQARRCHRQQLSALIDGELSPDAGALPAAPLQHDTELAGVLGALAACAATRCAASATRLLPAVSPNASRVAHRGTSTQRRP